MPNIAINSLLESGGLNADTREAITEAWEAQLAEAKEVARSELREEFARRYEHDKSVMVEALDKMVTESLTQEIAEFKDEKQALAEDRVKFQDYMRGSSNKFNDFMVEKLAEEIKELRRDRKIQKEGMAKLETFVMRHLAGEIAEFNTEKQGLAEDRVKFQSFMRESSSKFNKFMATHLAEEIQELRKDRTIQTESVGKLEKFVMNQLAGEIGEFAKDKQDLAETKVRLITGAKTKLAEMQNTFVKRSATLVKNAITSSLKSELGQLKEDITVARENMFGRRLFEAFASEFSVTHLNENKEIAKLSSLVKAKNRQLEEAKRVAAKSVQLVESKDRELKVIQESASRKQVLADLLGPLNKEKSSVMMDLLENVQTNKLRSVYDKYLPAVLNNTKSTPAPQAKVLSESRTAVTGDKTAKPSVQYDTDNVIEIKRLAGLK